MFSEETLRECRKLEEEWQREYRRLYGDQEWRTTTSSGIPLKPVYSPVDIESISYKDIGLPGLFPYTRATYPLLYQAVPWNMQQALGFGLPEHTRQRYEVLRKAGLRGLGVEREAPLFIPTDLPTSSGLDPDHPWSRGRVGSAGPTLSTMRDFELLFDGLPLEKVHVVFAAYDACLVLLPMYVVYAERRNISPQNLIGLSVYYFDIQVQADKVSFPPGAHLKLAVEFIRYCLNKVPRWLPMTFRSHGFQQAGANAIQASAFTLAMAIMLVEECIKAGLNPDDFVYRLGHHHTLTMDILETIAKVRAYRRMWARITRERFGCRNPRSYKANCQLQTSTSSLTWQQPLNNIIRTSLETLAGVLAGGNSLWTSAYDEGFTIPTEESAILAIRTNQIIMEETGLASVVDPLAGSYCLEWLTSRMEEEVTKLLAEIEQKGIFQCWESGWFKREIERSAYEWRRKVDSGELPIIGLNKYAIPDEKPNIKLFEHDLQVEKIAVERVRSFREKRDNASVTSALAGLKEAAAACKQGKGGNLFLVVEEAARRGATLGELMGVLREVFGYSFY